MEPFFIEVMPESAAKKTLSSHEGEEWIAVVKGSIEVIYGKETYILEEATASTTTRWCRIMSAPGAVKRPGSMP